MFQPYFPKQEDQTVLYLSDSFPAITGKKSCLECEVLMLNINIGHNKQLMEHCRVLYEYAVFIGKVRIYTAQGIKLKTAIIQASDECINQGILADLLRKNRAEVCNMVLREYDEAAHIANEKKISFEDGFESGFEDGFESGFENGEQRILLLMIQDDLSNGISKEDIITKLITQYQISSERANAYLNKILCK